MKKVIIFIMIVVSLSAKEYNIDSVKNSIVKIFTVASKHSRSSPWNSDIEKFSGSGCIIKKVSSKSGCHLS